MLVCNSLLKITKLSMLGSDFPRKPLVDRLRIVKAHQALYIPHGIPTRIEQLLDLLSGLLRLNRQIYLVLMSNYALLFSSSSFTSSTVSFVACAISS